MTLQPIPSEFPYIKFDFLFYQCIQKHKVKKSSQLTAFLFNRSLDGHCRLCGG